MGAIKFYTDEHIARAVVAGLRERGIDVITVAEASMTGATDDAQLAYARADGRVLITHDTDFLGMHAAGAPHSGIAYGPQGLASGEMIRRVMLIAQILDSEEMVNTLNSSNGPSPTVARLTYNPQ